LLVAKFHFQQLCALQNLFVFHIAIQFLYLAVQSLLAMAVVVFTAQHLQHLLIMSFHAVVVVGTIGKMLSLPAISATMLRLIST
jgi:hypothetical protein